MANPHDSDLPIALRRTPRHCVHAATTAPTQVARSRVVSAPLPTVLKTPSKPRAKKRVRFSDPGPEVSHHGAADLCSTGLTPMIKRSSLGEPSPKRRRASTGSNDAAPKRNAAKTRRSKQTSAVTAKAEAELQRLRAELVDRDAEIERLQNETLAHDTERIMELERQVEALRTELAQQQLPPLRIEDEDGNASDGDYDYDLPSRSFYDWTLAPRDPSSDSCLDADDFTAMDVVCSTPSRRSKSNSAVAPRSASASFPTPPCTSPTLPATPCSVRGMTPPETPHSHAGVQASLPDPEKEALEAELGSLRLELTKLTATLDTHAALQARLSEKLSSAGPLSPNPVPNGQPELEERVNAVLEILSSRTATLSSLNTSLSSLGFAGSDASEIIASIASGFRQARLELEYITPGEIALPLSSRAAEVLDLVVTRLRDLARKTSEDADEIDEYHALELSLRQQLSARFDAMEGMRAEQKASAAALQERDAHIAELEIGLDRLKGAAEGYRRDIGELEVLVQRLEGDGKAVETQLGSAEAQLAERTAVIGELETKLASTVAQAAGLETKLKALQRRKDAEAKVRNKSHGAALALRDARVLELRREIYGVNESLRSAHETILKLRLENAGLARRAEEAEEGRRLAQEAVDAMRAELEKVSAPAPRRRTRSSAAAEKGLATPEPQPGSFLSGDLARSGTGRGKGKGRRKYDSGLGLLDEDEDGDEVELVS